MISYDRLVGRGQGLERFFQRSNRKSDKADGFFQGCWIFSHSQSLNNRQELLLGLPRSLKVAFFVVVEYFAGNFGGHVGGSNYCSGSAKLQVGISHGV